MPRPSATTLSSTLAIRPTSNCSAGDTLPRRTVLTHRSCDSAAVPAIPRPATTARMVASAIDATNPSSTSPPTRCASNGSAMLPPGSAARIAVTSSSASAATPRPSRIKWKTTIRLVPRKAERRAARGVRHRVHAHQHVRQGRPAEGQAEQQGQRFPGVREQPAGLDDCGPPGRGPRMQHRERVVAEPRQAGGQHADREQQHQRRLDDLQPGHSQHAAQQGDRQHAGEDDQQRRGAGQAEQQVQDAGRANELGGEVGQDDDQLGDRDQRPQAGAAEPRHEHVAHGVFAQPLQRGGEQEQHQRPAGDDPDGEHHAIGAEQGDQPGDAEQTRLPRRSRLPWQRRSATPKPGRPRPGSPQRCGCGGWPRP